MQSENQRMHAEAVKCLGRAHAEVKRLGNHARFFPALVECHLEVIQRYLKEVDRVARDVWLSDGNEITPEFIRTVLVPRISTVIAARRGAIKHELDLYHARTRQDTARGQHCLAHEMNRFVSQTAQRYEIEAIELGKAHNLKLRAPEPIRPVSTSGAILPNPISTSSAGGLKPLDYPRELSQDARDRVEKAKIRASRELLPAICYDFKDEDLAVRCIMRIFLVFAREACALRSGLGWSLDRVQREAEEFLRKLTITVTFAKFPGCHRVWISNWNGSIQSELDRHFKASPEWVEYEEMLLADDAQKSPSAQNSEKTPADTDGAIELRRTASAPHTASANGKVEASANSAQSATGKPERGDPEVAKRAMIVRSNSNVPAAEMCEIFDRYQVPLPPKWPDAGFHTWSKTYKDPSYRSRIHTLISKDRARGK